MSGSDLMCVCLCLIMGFERVCFFLFRVCAAGPIMLIQAVVPHMVAKGKGKIVNVGSIFCYATAPFTGAYAASKAALQSSTEALR